MTYFKGTARIDFYEGGARIPDFFRKAIHNKLCEIPNGTIVEFVVKQRPRSTKQNSFYWGVAVPFVQGMFKDKGQAISAEQAHEIIFGAIIGHTMPVVMPNDKVVEVRKSSTELTTGEWEDAMTLLRAWCAQEGYNLPIPNEAQYE